MSESIFDLLKEKLNLNGCCNEHTKSIFYGRNIKKPVFDLEVHKWCHPLRREGWSAERWGYSISLISKMGDKGERERSKISKNGWRHLWMAPSVKKEKFSLANKFLINLSNCSSNASFTLRTYLLCGIDLGIPRYVILAKKSYWKPSVPKSGGLAG